MLKKLKKDKLSEDEMEELEGLGEYYYTSRGSDRSDPDLIRVIEELGEGASGGLARLKVVEVPDDVAWKIQECDGSEWIAELHRTRH